MKKLHTLLICLISSIHLPGWAGQNPSEVTLSLKYSQMPFRETPYADLKGIFPLTNEQAVGRKHYVISYDQLGRVREVKFVQDGEVIPLNINRNVVTHAPHIQVDYSEGKEVRTFFDEFGKQTHANGVYKEVYALDELGRRETLHFEDSRGERIESNWGIFEYQWSTDKRGTVTEQRFDVAGAPKEIRPGFPFYCLKLHYDQKGFLSMMENYGKDCKTLTQNTLNAAQDKLIYNQFGFMTSWNVYDANEQRSKGNGPGVARGVMEHDTFGNTTREYYLDEQGNPMSNAYGWFDSHAEFDRHGNMISRFNYDVSGKKSDVAQLGYAGYRIQYDETGRHRTFMSYFDANDNPVAHKARGYHAVSMTYDEKGRRVKLVYLDREMKKVNRLDNGIAEIQIAYDSQNQQAIRQAFDKNGIRI